MTQIDGEIFHVLLPNAIYRFKCPATHYQINANTTHYQINANQNYSEILPHTGRSLSNYQWHFSQNQKKISQFIWKHKRPQRAKTVLRKKNGAGGINLLDFRLHYNATIIRTVQYWHKNRNIGQWNKIESPETNLSTCGYLIFNKGGKDIQCGKDSLFDK